MKLDTEYTGTVKTAKIISKNIKTPEDEKIQKHVGVVEIEMSYNSGDLSGFVIGSTPDDIYVSSITWNDEIVGTYELNINDIVFNTKIVKISRKNKTDEVLYSLTFETEDLDKISQVGIYVKVKETPSNFKLNKVED